MDIALRYSVQSRALQAKMRQAENCMLQGFWL